MKNVEFYNDEIKEEYQKMVTSHHGLASILLSLIKSNGPIEVMGIEDDTYGKKMYVNTDDKLISIYLDFFKKKIYLKESNNEYSEIYDMHVKKNLRPSGRLYEEEERSITEKFMFEYDDQKDHKRYYELNDNNRHYVMIVLYQNEDFKEDEFINNLLHIGVDLVRISDVFLALTKIIDMNRVTIKLADSKGSNITTRKGKVTSYVEYVEKEDYHEKIYLENGKFFIDKKVKEEYQDDVTAYVKKIGVRDGKEKR